MDPLISIIIPTYNRAHLIDKTLDSIIAQTFTDWECIIVDDGSMDNTEEVINKYSKRDSRFKYFKRPTDRIKGPNSCRNIGFEMSKGTWINWFDSDDIYIETALERFVKVIHPDLDVIVAKLVKIDSNTNEVLGYNRIFTQNLIQDYYTGLVSFYVSGPLWNKLFLNNQKELFDEKIRFLDDWDFNLRMLYQKPKMKFIDEILINYIINTNSLSNQIYKLDVLEINSEIYAREKQLKIVRGNKLVDISICTKFTRDRYKTVLRDCLINDSKKGRILMYKMIVKNIELRDFKSLFKGIIGYFSFIIFGKGYAFFK
ncbi:glycosyltransferase involved in cell wall biosynthesis [Flavobacterium chryseum]|uniref:glycosyltransferase family 2 protein n=1 Tax=Flavobacterium sp. P3160 TaxID=2512113 RepID=UPI0010621209|nr:glycosyltransferase [Flavobacterium sp. P3160]TDO77464.1 glycosyltransferase involved in cell wall biosynthesis [Flavobacterium sp. P3160]